MGVLLQHPLAELEDIFARSILLHWSMRLRLGNWNVLRAFCRTFIFLFSNPVQSVQQRNGNICVHLHRVVEKLKVTADFSLYVYHMSQVPLKRFFLCYLEILCYIDFYFFSKGLKISALTLKPTEIIDYLFLPPLQLFTSCPSKGKGCAISRWFSVKQIFAEL